MTMQIKEIALYHMDGRLRRLPLRLGGLNVITGKSLTGKSSIIDVIDYCLGRSTFNVSEGVIRDSVAWYAAVFRVDDAQDIFVAKPAPRPGAESQSTVFLKVGRDLTPPPLADLLANSNDEALQAFLGQALGLTYHQHVPPVGQTRLPLQVGLSQVAIMLFQGQSTVANKEVLFHRQAEPFMPQAIKDSLPYLLGAVPEEHIQTLNDLRAARRLLREKELELQEAEAVSRGGTQRALALIEEARQVGIRMPVVEEVTAESVRAALEALAQWEPSSATKEDDERIGVIRDSVDRLRADIRDTSERIEAVQQFRDRGSSFADEIGHQVARLESLGVVEGPEDPSQCPVCQSRLETAVPTAADLTSRVQELRSQLQGVRQEHPHVQKTLAELTDKRERLRNELAHNQGTLVALERELEAARIVRDQNLRCSMVVGRVSLYLESVRPGASSVVAATEARARALADVARLEEKLEELSVEDRLTSILGRISHDMTAGAESLRLEFAGNPYRLDLKKLTVVCERPEKAFPMSRMGGGMNHMGCHVIAMLALHAQFRRAKRPVPGLLVLDQPSQVYFPSLAEYRALDGSTGETARADGDLESVVRLFQLLLEATRNAASGLQIIVLEHANIQEPWFQDCLVEAPWDGQSRALVPPSWAAR